MTNTRQPTQIHSQLILNYVLAGKRISNMEAYDQYGMICFLQRISNLPAAGVVIQDEVILKNCKRYKSYWIEQITTDNDEGFNHA